MRTECGLGFNCLQPLPCRGYFSIFISFVIAPVKRCPHVGYPLRLFKAEPCVTGSTQIRGLLLPVKDSGSEFYQFSPC